MRVQYDPSADAMYIRLAEGTVADSHEVREGVALDCDAAGKALGIELLDASKRVDNPREMAFEMLARRFACHRGQRGSPSGPSPPTSSLQRLSSEQSTVNGLLCSQVALAGA